jgi:hypothetical protein
MNETQHYQPFVGFRYCSTQPTIFLILLIANCVSAGGKLVIERHCELLIGNDVRGLATADCALIEYM